MLPAAVLVTCLGDKNPAGSTARAAPRPLRFIAPNFAAVHCFQRLRWSSAGVRPKTLLDCSFRSGRSRHTAETAYLSFSFHGNWFRSHYRTRAPEVYAFMALATHLLEPSEIDGGAQVLSEPSGRFCGKEYGGFLSRGPSRCALVWTGSAARSSIWSVSHVAPWVLRFWLSALIPGHLHSQT